MVAQVTANVILAEDLHDLWFGENESGKTASQQNDVTDKLATAAATTTITGSDGRPAVGASESHQPPASALSLVALVLARMSLQRLRKTASIFWNWGMVMSRVAGLYSVAWLLEARQRMQKTIQVIKQIPSFHNV